MVLNMLRQKKGANDMYYLKIIMKDGKDYILRKAEDGNPVLYSKREAEQQAARFMTAPGIQTVEVIEEGTEE